MSPQGSAKQNFPAILSCIVRTATTTNQKRIRIPDTRGPGALAHCWWECKISSYCRKQDSRTSKNSSITIGSSNSISEFIHSKELSGGSLRDICTSILKAALFTTAKKQRQPQGPSISKWISKMWQVLTLDCYQTKRKKIL